MKAKWDLFRETFINFNTARYQDDPVRNPIFEVITKADIEVMNHQEINDGGPATDGVSILASKYNLVGDDQTYTAPVVDIESETGSNDWLTKDGIWEGDGNPVTEGLYVTGSGVIFFYDRYDPDEANILAKLKASLTNHLVYYFPVEDITIEETEYEGEYELVTLKSEEYSLSNLKILPTDIDWVDIPETNYGTLEPEDTSTP